MISVVFLSSHNIALTERCLKSLAATSEHAFQQKPPLEVILGFQDADRKDALVDLIDKSSLETKLIFLPPGPSVPLLRNQLLKMRNPSSKWILFIDDDIEFPLGYFEQFEALKSRWPAARIFGGPNLTPAHQGGLAKESGQILGSYLNFICRDRYRLASEGPRPDSRDFILCNLIINSQSKPEFVPQLPFGEELELIDQLVSQGQQCVYSPLLHVFHHRRETLGALLEQMEKYGAGRGLCWGQGHRGFGLQDLKLVLSLFLVCLLASPFALVSSWGADWTSREATPLSRLCFLSLAPFCYARGLLLGFVRPEKLKSQKVVPAHVQA